MTYYLLDDGVAGQLYVDQPVIKRGDLPLVRNALSLRREAHKALAVLRHRAAEEYEEARHSGYEAGFEQGRDAGKQSVLDELAKLHREHHRQREMMRFQSVELAVELVRRICADLGRGHIVADIAANAILDLAPDGPVTILVNPACVPAVSEKLASVPYRIEIDEREDAEPGYCLIKTAAGQLDVSIDVQLEKFARSLKDAIATETGHD